MGAGGVEARLIVRGHDCHLFAEAVTKLIHQFLLLGRQVGDPIVEGVDGLDRGDCLRMSAAEET